MSQTISNDYISMINKKGSGYNIPVIVDAIVNAEIDPIRTQVTAKIDATDATISGLASMKSSANTSKTSIDAFNANLNFSLSSSKTASLTITSKDDGELSSFSKQITVIAMAKSQTFTTSGYNTANIFGAQTIQVRDAANNLMGTVTVAAGETVGAVAGKLDRVAGLNAELINDGSGSLTPHTLLITSSEPGQANNFTISSNVAAHRINAMMGDGRINPGQDASLDMDGVPVTRPTNTIDDLVKGATIDLLAEGVDPITVASTLSSASVMATVKELMAELNLYKADLDALGFVDTVGDADGALAINSYLKSAQTQFARFMAKPLMGYVSNDVENVPVYFVEFGIKTTRAGAFEFDKQAFDRTFAREPEKFAALAVDRAYSSDPNTVVTSTASATIPTGAHGYRNSARTAQQAGRASLQAGEAGSFNNLVHASTITYQVEGGPTHSYTTDGTKSLSQIAVDWQANKPADQVNVSYNSGRLSFTWAGQDNTTTPIPRMTFVRGDDVDILVSNPFTNAVTGVAMKRQMAGFSGTTHPLPAQTVRYTVTNDIINVGDTASSSSGTINIPEGQTLTNFVTAFNGQGNGISASISGTGTSTKLHLEATNPSTAYSFTIDTIPIAVAPVAQVIEMSKTYAAGELVAAETISLTVTANGGGGTTTNFIPDGNQTPAQAVIAFNALNNGITASTFAGGTRLRFAATDPSTAHSFTVGNIPAAGGGQATTTPGSSGSASGVQSITATGNRTWRDSLTENDGVGTDERFADEVSHESGDPAYNWERVEVPPAGSGVYRTDLYTGFQFETTSDQTDMTFYIARSAKTELSRFFKDALSTSGIYRTVVDAYTDEGNTLAKRLDTIDERKLTLQARYTKQFAAMETVVTGGSSTSEFLTNLVAGWNKD